MGAVRAKIEEYASHPPQPFDPRIAGVYVCVCVCVSRFWNVKKALLKILGWIKSISLEDPASIIKLKYYYFREKKKLEHIISKTKWVVGLWNRWHAMNKMGRERKTKDRPRAVLGIWTRLRNDILCQTLLHYLNVFIERWQWNCYTFVCVFNRHSR